ncbi:MAG TPA: SIS domain-containing protein, partial [Anaerolineaceae bacterium]
LVAGCQVVAVSTGGQLAEKAQAAGVPFWRFEHKGQPRAAVGFSFGLLLAMITRLGLIPDPTHDLQDAIAEMKVQQQEVQASSPVAKNPAKRMAGQLMGRIPVILGADFLEPVARRWKGQVSELAKSWGQFEFLPEADHNSLAGIVNPGSVLEKDLMVLFLRSKVNHPRNLKRIELTRSTMMQAGINTDIIETRGETPLAQIWTSLHLGDYTGYYLAMAYQEDPTPVDALETFKAEMKS